MNTQSTAAPALIAVETGRSDVGEARVPRWGRPEIARWVVEVAKTLDSKYRIPGLGVRFGLDGLLGLIPIVGDLLTALYGTTVLLEAYRLRVPTWLIGRMLGNLAVDAFVGTIPIVGDAADFFYKPNERNLRMLESELARRQLADPRSVARASAEREENV